MKAKVQKKKQNKWLLVKNWIKESKIFNKRTVKYVIFLIVFLLITNPSLIPFLPQRIKTTLTYALMRVFGDVSQISRVIPLNWIRIFQLVVMILILIIITNIIRGILENIHPKSSRKKTFITLFMSTNRYLFTIIGIIWGLKILGVNTSTIFASVGIVALIVGFSAESLIADVVTGLFLLFDNPYNVGDIIEVGNFRGTVIKIGIRTTSIEDAGNNIKVINNSDMRNIINRSSVTSKAVCDITIPISKDILVVEKLLEKLLKDIKERHSDIMEESPQYMGVQALEKDGMVIRIIVPVEEKNIYDAQRILNREVKVGLQKELIWGKS